MGGKSGFETKCNHRVLERISDAKHHAYYLKGENTREVIKINALQDLLHRANNLAADINSDFA